MKPLDFHRLARAEFYRAMAYYERQTRGAGLKLHSKVYAAASRIQENPKVGSPEGDPHVRSLKVRGCQYVIYYEEHDEFIGILAVAHGSRKSGYWKRRKFH